jgi:hypothetical protein
MAMLICGDLYSTKSKPKANGDCAFNNLFKYSVYFDYLEDLRVHKVGDVYKPTAEKYHKIKKSLLVNPTAESCIFAFILHNIFWALHTKQSSYNSETYTGMTFESRFIERLDEADDTWHDKAEESFGMRIEGTGNIRHVTHPKGYATSIDDYYRFIHDLDYYSFCGCWPSLYQIDVKDDRQTLYFHVDPESG